MIGRQLEKRGWRQGSIVNSADVPSLLASQCIAYDENTVLVVASQSCDIANGDIQVDPNIELSLATRINSLDGNYSHNKNARILHTGILCRSGDENVYLAECLEILASKKISIHKNNFADLYPDSDKNFEDKQLRSYVFWLAARYSRPALPTSFNERIKVVDPKNKARAKAKKGNEQLTGIYVEILPDQEISDDESYRVNLLGLLPAGFSGDVGLAENAINFYANILRDAGMEVFETIKREDDVSLAVIQRFKRFYYDDLSFREGAPLPPENETLI